MFQLDHFLSHAGFGDPFVILESLIVVNLVRMMRLVLAAFKDGEETLVDADVLLLSLHHPHALLPHLVDDAEDIDAVVFPDQLLKKESQQNCNLVLDSCLGVCYQLSYEFKKTRYG